MATYEMKMSGRVDAPASLASRLEMIGIKVPDQSRIPHMMEATRIGLLPTVSRLRLALAWYRRWKHKDVYVRYDYNDFIMIRDEFVTPESRNKRIAHEWGGMPPAPVMKSMETIKARMSEAKCFVDATKTDPWSGVMDPMTGEVVYIHCWVETAPHEKVIQLI